MPIEPVEMFAYLGKTFPSHAKAVDHAEGLVFEAVKSYLIPRGFTVSECFKVAETINTNRAEFRALLNF